MMPKILRGYIVSLFSKRKKLLAVGCSYTDNCWTKPQPYMLSKVELNEESKVGWKHGFSVWPEILAEKLDMECYNFGASGQGNSYILEKTYDQINKTNWDLVVLMWSEFQRLDFENRHGHPENAWKSIHHFRDNSLVNNLSHESTISLLKIANVYAMTQRSVRFFHLAQTLLKDIPYIMVQGVMPMYGTKEIDKECANSIIASPFLNEIDDTKFMGFPTLKNIGGWCMDDMLDKKDPDRISMRISAEDTHPNDKGHEYMAELIYNKYREIYL